MDAARPYQALIADVLFWHSVVFDKKGYARGVALVPLTLESIRGRSRVRWITDARRDIAKALRERDHHVFSMSRIGAILGRHHTTVIAYLYRKRRNRDLDNPPLRSVLSRRAPHVEGAIEWQP